MTPGPDPLTRNSAFETMRRYLTLAEIQAALNAVTYRPGWTFTAAEDPFGEGHTVRLEGPVPNAYRPDETVVLGINSYLPPIPDAAYLDRWLLWRLQRVEAHETREWLQRDGRPIFDPHTP